MPGDRMSGGRANHGGDALRGVLGAADGLRGLLVLVKLLDLLMFEEAFAQDSVHPKREPKPGGYRMVVGVLLLVYRVLVDQFPGARSPPPTPMDKPRMEGARAGLEAVKIL